MQYADSDQGIGNDLLRENVCVFPDEKQHTAIVIDDTGKIFIDAELLQEITPFLQENGVHVKEDPSFSCICG